MPSKDSYHRKHPEVNEWMQRSKSGIASRSRNVSAQLMRLAQRLGRDPDELAKKIPADTVRRTKYPVIEVVNDDGTRSFKHDIGIHEGRTHA